MTDLTKRVVNIRYSKMFNIGQLEEIKLRLKTEIVMIETRIKELR